MSAAERALARLRYDAARANAWDASADAASWEWVYSYCVAEGRYADAVSAAAASANADTLSMVAKAMLLDASRELWPTS